MISTRWSTENHRELAPQRSQPPAPVSPSPPSAPLLQRPVVMMSVALGVGIVIGILVKRGWRR